MPDSYASNPFQAIEISIPKDLHRYFENYCQRSGSGTNINREPFPRMVDLWFFSLCVAARLDLKPVEIDEKKSATKIMTGVIFGSDPWRINTIMLLAIAKSDDVNIVADPARMMKIANGLAIAGIPEVVKMLEGDSDPIWDLSDATEKMLKEQKEN